MFLCYYVTMSDERVPISINKDTHRKLSLMKIITGKSLLAIIDRLVNIEYKSSYNEYTLRDIVEEMIEPQEAI